MKPERYKRFCIELVNTPRHLEREPDMDARMNVLIDDWSRDMLKKHPGFSYRICNGETSAVLETDRIQPVPSSIRFVLHIAYTT